MSCSFVSRVLVGVVAGLVVAASMASTARADIVADWQFNGANFFTDSSGHGHTLSITSGTVTQVGDAASFSGGGGVLSANIDLTPYRQVTISWDQNATDVTNEHIVYEDTPNYNLYVGPMLGEVNSAHILCGHNNDYNIDTFTPATGPQSYSVTYNLDATTGADVVKVFQGTTEIGHRHRQSVSSSGRLPQHDVQHRWSAGWRCRALPRHD